MRHYYKGLLLAGVSSALLFSAVASATVPGIVVQDIPRSAIRDQLAGYWAEMSEDRFDAAPSLETSIAQAVELTASEEEFASLMNDMTAIEAKYGLRMSPENMDEAEYLNKYGIGQRDLQLNALLSSVTIRDEDLDIYRRLMHNLTIPFPDTGGLTQEELQAKRDEIEANGGDPNTVFGKPKEVVAARMKQAVLSAAQSSFINMILNRLPLEDGRRSVMHVMREGAESRMLSPGWQGQLATASPEAIMREMASMQAYQNWMMYKSYLQGERIEALLSGMLSTQGDMAGMAEGFQNTLDSANANTRGL